jgi:hypothetical protein
MYSAVIECVPGAICFLVKVATPPLNGIYPIPVVPSLNQMLPVGAKGPAGVTVAVNVTAWPDCEGFRLEVSTVVVGYLLTTCFTHPVLGPNVLSPS